MVQFYFVKMGYFLSRERAVTLLGKIFLGFLVSLNHFQVPISSLLLLVPRNLLETHSYGNLQVSGLCELIYKNA